MNTEQTDGKMDGKLDRSKRRHGTDELLARQVEKDMERMEGQLDRRKKHGTDGRLATVDRRKKAWSKWTASYAGVKRMEEMEGQLNRRKKHGTYGWLARQA